MPRSDMRHPYFESLVCRDRRRAAEEIRRAMDKSAAQREAMIGRRILPALTATQAMRPEARP